MKKLIIKTAQEFSDDELRHIERTIEAEFEREYTCALAEWIDREMMGTSDIKNPTGIVR